MNTMNISLVILLVSVFFVKISTSKAIEDLDNEVDFDSWDTESDEAKELSELISSEISLFESQHVEQINKIGKYENTKTYYADLTICKKSRESEESNENNEKLEKCTDESNRVDSDDNDSEDSCGLADLSSCAVRSRRSAHCSHRTSQEITGFKRESAEEKCRCYRCKYTACCRSSGNGLKLRSGSCVPQE